MEKFRLRDHIGVLAIITVLMMTVLDSTLVNVALPVFASELGVSDSASVWIVTIYQLAITMLLLPLSAVGDLYSYRRNFLCGVVIFTLSSLGCAMAQSFPAFIIARAFQGIGAAGVMSVNIALTRLIYPRQFLARGLALNAMVIAVATAAGPTLAGIILSFASWHWLFLINIPFGFIAYFIGRAKLPANPNPGGGKFDWLSGIMNAATFGLLFYAFGNLSRKGDTATSVILLAVGLLIGVFYIRRQFNRKKPMLPVDLFRNPLYSMSIITSVCSFIAQNLAMISLPFLFLSALGYSEIATGLLMTPWSIATVIVSPLAGRFVERHNPGLTAAVGMGVYMSGMILLGLLPESGVSVGAIVWRMALCGIGFGLFQTPNNVVMVIATPTERTGSAGGMQSTARLVGQTFGATVVTLIFALAPRPGISVHICLGLAAALAAVAGILSLFRGANIRRHHSSL